MIRFNEERIGRLHVYFQADEGGHDAPLGPNSGVTVEGPNGEGFANTFLGPNGGLGDRAGASWTGGAGMSGSPSTSGGVPSGVSTTTTASGGNTTTPTSATQAQETARTAATRAALQSEPFSGTGVTGVSNAVRAGGIDVSQTINNVLGGETPVPESAQNLGQRTYEAGLRNGLTPDQAAEAARNAIQGTYGGRVAGAFTPRTPSSGAPSSATGDSTAPAAPAPAAVATATNTNTPEEAAAVGEKTAEEISETVEEPTTPRGAAETYSQGASATQGMAQALAEGKVSVAKAAAFSRGLSSGMARQGITSIYTDFAKAQVGIGEVAGMFQVGADMRGVEFTAQMSDKYVAQVKYQAAIEAAQELGLTEAEIKSMMESLTVFDNADATPEEVSKAVDSIIAQIAAKVDPNNQTALARIVEMFIGIEQQVAARITNPDPQKEVNLELSKAVVKWAKEAFENGMATREVFKEFEGVYQNEKAEAKAEEQSLMESYAKVERFLHDCENLLKPEGSALIPKELFAIQFVTEHQVASYQRGWHLGVTMLKFVISIIAMPFSPMFAITSIVSIFKGMDLTENVPAAMTNPETDLVDFYNDPEVQKFANEIVAENSGLFNAAGALRNKGIKGVALAALALLSGNVGMFAIGIGTSLVSAMRYEMSYARIRSYLPNLGNNPSEIVKMSTNGDKRLRLDVLQKFALPYQGIIAQSYEHITNEDYGYEVQEGGNKQDSELDTWNAGIGSEQEVEDYIRENIRKDEITRRLANAI